MLPDTFLLSYVGFDVGNAPIVDIEVEDRLTRHHLLDTSLSITFDLSTRYCTGWVDMEQHKAHPCPNHAIVEGKYEQCVGCRNKTGFNPAFYHAKSVSKQQEALNQNPHFVYLAYFAPDSIKVGISQEARGIRRILEQGARIAIKLETFSSAIIARQYEAKISSLPNIVEHVIHKKKLALLSQPFDESTALAQLEQTKALIEQSIHVSFDNAITVQTAPQFGSEHVSLENVIIMHHQPALVGRVRSVIGSDAILEHDKRLLAYNLKSYLGYRAHRTDSAQIDLPSEQMTLF